jgi:hypothetical protein
MLAAATVEGLDPASAHDDELAADRLGGEEEDGERDAAVDQVDLVVLCGVSVDMAPPAGSPPMII